MTKKISYDKYLKAQKYESNQEIKEAYREDTVGRKYHAPIVGKNKPRLNGESGPVTSVNLNEPMTWAEFRGLSDTLRIKYLEHLRDYYKATVTCIAEMMGTHRTRLSGLISKMGRQGMFSRGASKLAGNDLEKWNAFLNSGKKIPLKIEENLAEELEEFVDELAGEDVRESVSVVNNTVNALPTPAKDESDYSMRLSDCEFTFKGKFNIQDIVKRLSACIDEGTECRIKILMYGYDGVND